MGVTYKPHMFVDLTTHAPNTVHVQQFTFYQETGSIQKGWKQNTIFQLLPKARIAFTLDTNWFSTQPFYA